MSIFDDFEKFKHYQIEFEQMLKHFLSHQRRAIRTKVKELYDNAYLRPLLEDAPDSVRRYHKAYMLYKSLDGRAFSTRGKTSQSLHEKAETAMERAQERCVEMPKEDAMLFYGTVIRDTHEFLHCDLPTMLPERALSHRDAELMVFEEYILEKEDNIPIEVVQHMEERLKRFKNHRR